MASASGPGVSLTQDTNSMDLQVPSLFHTGDIHRQKSMTSTEYKYKCNVENVPRDSTVLLIPTYKCKHIQHRLHNGSSLLGAKNIKCAIKFVRALITKFSHNKIVLNWKIAENKNILGMVLHTMHRNL